MRIQSMLLAGVLLASGTVGCRSARRTEVSAGGEVEVRDEKVAIVVRNDNYLDVNVYAVASSGQYQRLGTVTGNGRGTFTLRESFSPTGSFSLVADPIGANGNVSSGTLLVHGGQTVEFTIAPVLAQSMATVR